MLLTERPSKRTSSDNNDYDDDDDDQFSTSIYLPPYQQQQVLLVAAENESERNQLGSKGNRSAFVSEQTSETSARPRTERTRRDSAVITGNPPISASSRGLGSEEKSAMRSLDHDQLIFAYIFSSS